MGRKKVLAINLGWEQEPLLDELQKRELEIYGVHDKSNYYRGVEYADIKIASFRDIESIGKFAEKVQPNSVISDQCDYSFFAQAYLAEKYDLPGPTIKEAQISSNKYLQRVKAEDKDLLIPEYQLVSNIDEVKEFAKRIGFPIILKPIDNRGSIGVERIDSTNEIKDAFFNALENSKSWLLIVERFVQGREITIDGYIFNGTCYSIALATKQLISEKNQVAVDIIYPGELSPNLYARAMKINEEVNSMLGYSFGMTHSEYKINSDGEIFLIESANRGGGVYTSEVIVPNVTGIDTLDQYINDCLGIKATKNFRSINKNPVILKFLSLKEGEVQKIEGLQEIKEHPEVLKLRLAVSEGDIITKISSDANRHGFLIVKSEKPREKANKLIEKIKFIYK